MVFKQLISLLCILLTVSCAHAEVVVIMRREAQSSGKYVRICDVARVDGPRDQAKEVAMVVLGPSPYHGETREITRWDIEARLFEMGIDARVMFSGNDMVRVFGDGMPGRMDWGDDEAAFTPLRSIPDRMAWEAGRSDGSEVAGVDVNRSRSSIAKPAPRPYEAREQAAAPSLLGESRRRVELAVSDYLAGRYRNAKSKRRDIEVETKVLSVSSEIPHSAFDVVVDEAVDGQVPGKATLRVRVKDREGDSFRNVMVVADTDVFGQTLVAARHIAKGELLEARDVTVGRIRMDSGKGYLPPSPSNAAGRETKRSYKPGEPILAADAVPGLAIRRGSEIVVENRGKGWMVQTKAKALGAGAVGDMITVQDVSNKTKYQARIIAPGTVTAILKRDAHGIIEKKQS